MSSPSLIVQKKTSQLLAEAPAVALFSRDADGKCRGSWFDAADMQAVKQAAALMGVQLVMVKSEAIAAAAGRMPKGRIFTSGKAFMPLIQSSVYETLAPHAAKQRVKLAVVASAEAQAAPKVAPASQPVEDEQEAVAQLPPDWARIGVGHTVLAHSIEDEAWFEAVVVEAGADGLYTLKWRDYQDQPSFQRRRHFLALLFPKAAATA